MKSETLAKLCVAYSGIAWGLFWLPLHGMTAGGMTPEWAVFVFNIIPTIIVLPIVIWRWRQGLAGGLMLAAAGLAMGMTQIFYALSVLHTEVVRAITIFYLNPVWTALMARFLLGEKLGLVGLLSMILAFLGMSLVLRSGFSLPLPRNLGDWSAIIASVAWASSVILLRMQPHGHPVDLGAHSMLWTGVLMIPMPFVLSMGTPPALASIVPLLWWLLPFVILVMMTGIFVSMWAVPKLPPNLVSLIYMTEISTAAITAALFASQPFGWQDALGVVLITLAGALSSIIVTMRGLATKRSAPQNSSTG